jgi:PAS domain S-box-containing protein
MPSDFPGSADEARLRLAAIVESSDDAIVSKNLAGIITSWNAAAERIFGYTAAEMVGKPITTIIPPELHDEEREILSKLFRGERIEHFETIRVTKAGNRIEVSLTISPIKDESGRVIGAAKIARDVGDRKRAERALRISERLASVGRLAATVAHEINNPLESVMNLIYLAKTDPSASPQIRDFLQMADEELQRVIHITKQTLGFYREQRGIVPVSVGGILQQLVSVFSPKINNQGIGMRLELRHDADILASPGELRQLFANLLTNSIDAAGPGGLIRIRTSTAFKTGQQPHIRVSVCDSGPGIPVAIRKRIFEPFFTTKDDVGTGLGLWVCSEILQRYNGSMRIRSSTQPGRSWTVFSVKLPARPQPSVVEIRKRA